MIDSVSIQRTIPAEAIRIQPLHHQVRRTTDVGHVLIPLTLADREIPAIRMGLQIASGTQAKVTLLHVVPPAPSAAPQGQSRNWLDSIDQLHDSLSGVAPHHPTKRGEPSADQLRSFFSRLALSSPIGPAELNLVARAGEFCDEVVRFTESQGVDLVILPGELLQSWIPVPSARLGRKLQRLGRRVLGVWPEANDRQVRLRTGSSG